MDHRLKHARQVGRLGQRTWPATATGTGTGTGSALGSSVATPGT
jgi:hypothetical protein